MISSPPLTAAARGVGPRAATPAAALAGAEAPLPSGYKKPVGVNGGNDEGSPPSPSARLEQWVWRLFAFPSLISLQAFPGRVRGRRPQGRAAAVGGLGREAKVYSALAMMRGTWWMVEYETRSAAGGGHTRHQSQAEIQVHQFVCYGPTATQLNPDTVAGTSKNSGQRARFERPTSLFEAAWPSQNGI
jgi:hypothetical protein